MLKGQQLFFFTILSFILQQILYFRADGFLAKPVIVILKYEEIIPSEPLREYVECFWTLISDSSLHEELCLPDGSASLVFNFGPPYLRTMSYEPTKWDEFGRCSLPHQGKHSVLITQSSPVRIIGVRFKPYGMAPFFNVSMNQFPAPFILHGEKLEPFLGGLEEQLLATDDFQERIRILENNLLKRVDKASSPDKLVTEAVSVMVKNGGNLKISDLHEQLCVSKSTLEKKFQEHVGLSPKILCNIFRLNSIVYSHQQEPTPSLTELSYKQGFFDQAHLVHNFRSFTGLPPGQFFKQDNLLIEMLRQSFETRISEIY